MSFLGRLIYGERPPVRRRSFAEYAAEFSARWHPAYGPRTLHRKAPRHYGPLEVDLTAHGNEAFPEMGILEVENGHVFGTEGVVYGRDGVILPEASWYGGEADLAGMLAPTRVLASRRLRGVVLNLATDFARKNWGHFLLDLVPRIHLFQRAGFGWCDVDAVYLPRPPNPDGWRVLERAGVPREKCVWAARGRFYRADRWLVTSFPALRQSYPDWSVAFLRALFGEARSGSGRRLYLPRDRRCRRRLINEEAIRRILRGNGFEEYRFGGGKDQFRDFSEAEAIVGPHGAALANLTFCRPGTRVLEMIPTDHVYPYYYTVSDSADLHYAYVAGRSLGHREPGSRHPSPFDFHVDEAALRAALGAVL